jgi:hypothetical protein
LLLPCNVVVRAGAGHTVAESLTPQVMVTVIERSGTRTVADEAACRLGAALDALRA